MMSHLRWAAPLLAALALTLALAAPATALSFTEQCDQSGGCLNFWAGGFAVESWYGTTGNNEIAVQWLNPAHTSFELRDNVHGGCIADLGGAQGNARAGGGQSCPSSGTAAWGSTFTPDYGVCPPGWAGYRNNHWRGYIYVPPGNGQVIYLNSGVDCLRQQT